MNHNADFQKSKKSGTVAEYTSFRNFLLQKEQVIGISLWTLISLVAFLYMNSNYATLFKSGDTYSYIGGAVTGFNPYRPMGYSWVLQFIAYFSMSTSALFYTQFALNYCATVFLLLSIKFFIPAYNKLSQVTYWIISVLIMLAPARIYLTNNVNSDSVFISITLLWLATMLWIIHTKKLYWAFIHLLFMVIAIFIRYSALVYPVISLVLIGFVFKHQLKIALSLLTTLPWLMFLIPAPRHSVFHTYTETYTAFSGWQLANNALHIIPSINLAPESFKEENLVKLHRIVKLNPDSVYTNLGLTYDYIWHKDLPLKQNCFRIMEEQNISYFAAWPKNSKILKSYASALIIKFPFTYFRHFLWPNFLSLCYPVNLEALAENNYINQDNGWFESTTLIDQHPESDVFQMYLVKLIPISNALLWILMLSLLGIFVYKNGLQNVSSTEKLIIGILCMYLIVLVVFHVFASPIVYRFLLTMQPVQYILVYLSLITFNKNKRVITPLPESTKSLSASHSHSLSFRR